MTFCRGNVGVALVNDKLWAVGGFSGKSFLNNVEFLDPVTDEWTTYLSVVEKEEVENGQNGHPEDVLTNSGAEEDES